MSKKRRLIAVLSLGCIAASPGRELPFPKEAESIQTVERSIFGVSILQGEIFAFLKGTAFALRIPFSPEDKDIKARFGQLLDQVRQNLPAALGASWRSIERYDKRYLLFDALRLSTAEVDAKDFTPLIERSIVWDLIRPPADRGGEATRSETAEVRAKFQRQLRATSGVKISGLARIPASWVSSNDSSRVNRYLMASRIPDFPLLMLECQADEPSQCMIARYCQLSPKLAIEPEAIVGFGLSEKRRLLIFGDPTRHQLVLYKWQSCYRSTLSPIVLKLPRRLKTLVSLSTDFHDRLWIVSDEPDDMLNASIYFWESW